MNLKTSLALFVSLTVIHVNKIVCNNLKQLSHFERALQSPYFVDKTPLLKTFNEHRLSLITCPTDFGKSTNLDMTRQFFQMVLDENTGRRMDRKNTASYRLFTNKSLNLQITQDEEFIEKHLGEYPILYLTFANVRGNTSTEIIDWMFKRVLDTFDTYDWLYKLMRGLYINDPFRRDTLNDYERIVNRTADIHDVYGGFELILEFIVKHFHTDLIIFFEHFDAPILYALSHGLDAQQIHHIVEMLLDAMVEGSEFTSHIMAVGVSQVLQSYESEKLLPQYFSDANPFAEYFGFTEPEVHKLLSTKPLHDQRSKLKQYFNSYHIKESTTSLYSPGGILRYLETGSFESTNTDRVMPKIMMCLRHEKFFQQISQMLTSKRTTYNSNEKMMTTYAEGKNVTGYFAMALDNCSNPDMPNEELVPLLVDLGYFTTTEEPNEYAMTNKIMENRLRKEFKNFFLHTYDVTIPTTPVTTSLNSILNSDTTTDDMLTALGDSLNQLLKPNHGNLTKFQFMSIITAALLCSVEADQHVVMEMASDNRKKANLGIHIIKSVDESKKIQVIIKVIFKKSLDEAIRQAKDHISHDHPPVPSSIMKYLGINVNENNRVEVGK